MMRNKLQNLRVHHLKAVRAGLHKLFSYDLLQKQQVIQTRKIPSGVQRVGTEKEELQEEHAFKRIHLKPYI